MHAKNTNVRQKNVRRKKNARLKKNIPDVILDPITRWIFSDYLPIKRYGVSECDYGYTVDAG